MTFFKTLAAVAVLGFSINSFALDLDEARSSGKVKELATGYIVAVETSAEVAALVKEVNNKRKKHYEKVAKKNGTSIEVVSQTAAEKIKEKLKK